MPDHTTDDVFAPPATRPAPHSLRTTISQLADDQSAPRRRVALRNVIAPVAAASVLALGIVGANQLGGSVQVSPAGGGSTSPTPGLAHTPRESRGTATSVSSTQIERARAVPLTAAQTAAQRKTCLAQGGDDTAGHTWRTVYAQRVTVLGTPDTQSVLVLDSGKAHVTCLDGSFDGWSLYGPGSKIVPRTPTTDVPAVISDGLFNTVTDYAQGKKLVTFGAQVGPTVTAGRARVVTSNGAGPWLSSPAKQGWLLMEIVASSTPGTTVEFQATDRSGNVVKIADSDGRPITTLTAPTTKG